MPPPPPPPCPVSTANQLLNLPPCYLSSPSRYLEMLFSISSPQSRNMAEFALPLLLKVDHGQPYDLLWLRQGGQG